MNDETTKGYMKSFLSYVNASIILLMGFALIIPVVYSYLAHKESILVYVLFFAGFIFVVVALIKMMMLLNKSNRRI